MFVVIGLGSFGQAVVRELHRSGEDVLAIDQTESRVQDIKEYATRAVILDSTDSDALRSMGVHEARAAVVAIGRDLSAAVLTVIALKELKVPMVIAKATSSGAEKALLKVGASESVYPEEAMGVSLAHRLRNPRVVEIMQCGEDHAIVEVRVPSSMSGKSLKDLGIREKFRVMVIGTYGAEDHLELAMDPNQKLQQDQRLVVAGSLADIKKFSSLK